MSKFEVSPDGVHRTTTVLKLRFTRDEYERIQSLVSQDWDSSAPKFVRAYLTDLLKTALDGEFERLKESGESNL